MRGRGGILTRWTRTTRFCRRIVKTSKRPKDSILDCLSPWSSQLRQNRRGAAAASWGLAGWLFPQIWSSGQQEKSANPACRTGIAASGRHRERLLLLPTSAPALPAAAAAPAADARCTPSPSPARPHPSAAAQRAVSTGAHRPLARITHRPPMHARPAGVDGAESAAAWHGMMDGRPAAAPLSLAAHRICHRLMQAASTLASAHRGPCLLRPSALPDRRQAAFYRACVLSPEISSPAQSPPTFISSPSNRRP